MYILVQVAFAASVYLLGLPQPLFTLSIVPLPFLAMRWPRWALAVALLALFALGSALSLLVADAPGAEIRRIVIQVVALGALTELTRRVVRTRTEALAALAVAEARHRLLVESLNVIPWELDLATGRYVYLGPQAERLLGYPISEWRGVASWEAMTAPRRCASASTRRSAASTTSSTTACSPQTATKCGSATS